MRLLFPLLAIFSLSGCATTGALSNLGFSLVAFQTESGGIAHNKVKPELTGKSCATNLLGVYSSGDSGIEAARKDGGLKKVAYFDTEFLRILGLYGSVCTKVYGL